MDFGRGSLARVDTPKVNDDRRIEPFKMKRVLARNHCRQGIDGP